MSNFEEQYTQAKQRMSSIRLRTWTLTLAILVTIVFALVVNLTTKSAISLVDFALLCILQIVVHSLYFPDGELFGQKNGAFISNKTSYNLKAEAINKEKKISLLRQYCKVEFEERKKRYLENACGKIGISVEELELFKKKTEKEIKKLENFEIFEEKNGEKVSKIIIFNKQRRKILRNLLFKPLPIEENHPETIMSAVENNGTSAVKDGSIQYKSRSYLRKILTAVCVGGVIAYIGYTVRDGFGLAQIVQILMYITTLFTTAVMAYTSGETCTKVHKTKFYLDLINFIDGFNEWSAKQKQG